MLTSRIKRSAAGVVVAMLTLAALVAAPVDPAGGAEINGGRFPTEQAFVDQAYRDFLARGPDAGGLAFWSNRLRTGTAPEDLIEELLTSPEFEGRIAPIVRLYRSIFDRLPDLDGLRFWIARARSGESLERIASQFLAGAEFEELAQAQTTDEVVAAIYGRSLGREPDAGGLAFWRGEIDAGRLTLAGFAAAVSESAEHKALRRSEVVTSLIFLGLLQRLPDPGGLAFWTGQVDQGLPIRTFAASVMGLPEYQDRFPTPPEITSQVVASGLRIPWDIESLPDGTIVFTERSGGVTLILPSGEVRPLAGDFSDLFANGETGLMGLAVDPGFSSNRRIYTCQGHASPREIQVIAWTLDVGLTGLTRVNDPLVGGLPIGSGRHGGCQLEFDADGNLFVGTGDAATGSHPQNLGSLGGKVLRVDPATGGPVAGNPFIASTNPNTRLIYTYGHRNVQGLGLRPDTNQMWSVEHGPARDDEVNVLRPGGNAGWNPVPGYNEAVPMTNLSLPNAFAAAYATGAPTLALSGGDWVDHPSWGPYDNSLGVAALKNQTLRLLLFNQEGLYLGQGVIVSGDFGRLRAVHQAADGSLYISTSTGSDSIIKLTAS